VSELRKKGLARKCSVGRKKVVSWKSTIGKEDEYRAAASSSRRERGAYSFAKGDRFRGPKRTLEGEEESPAISSS